MQNSDRSKKLGAMYADRTIDRAVYDALYDVFIGGAYCARALTAVLKKMDDPRTHAFVTRAFYGVLDKNIRLEKIINGLCEKTPQKDAEIILKIGIYYIKYADMPVYAAVNRSVELSKTVVGVYSGFINAVLKKSIDYKPVFKSEIERFSYEHCAPLWLCKMLISDYSETKAAAILDAELPESTHIRPVLSRISAEKFAETAAGLELTEYGCYCDKRSLERFYPGTYAVQSLSSVRAVRKYCEGIDGGKVLDLCAAPGGKSVYLSELGNFDITACDIYEHKIDLMRGYAKKLGAQINTVLNDATVINRDFIDRFDMVIADCPCSGTGTLKAKPDIMLRRKLSDLDDLKTTQCKILDCAAKYCKAGGILCYSTCSILNCENEETVKAFLDRHKDYELKDTLKLLPDTDKCDGFYIARFKRCV